MYSGVIFGLLALIAGLLYRARLKRVTGEGRTALSDELLRQIEETGTIAVDEPLDIEEIQAEEARFWEDRPWEDTDEW
ncbi:MAG: hypothetical protein WEF86_12790 [Gemmatimonadota bacterium]